MGAITLKSEVKQHLSLAPLKKKTAKMTPPIKRYTYAQQAGHALRDSWLNNRSK
jgi:hypothetical protein